MSPAEPRPEEAAFRWQSLFQQSSEPLFLLNRRRRVLFVNRAWETLTGLKLADVKGQVCRRRPRGILTERHETILAAMVPPTEVYQGRISQSRRHPPGEDSAWRICFIPLRGESEPLGILGKIEIIPEMTRQARQPIPEKILQLRERAAARFGPDQWIGDDPAMQRLRAQIALAAKSRVPVLLAGPKGAGKKWIARAIHEQISARQHFFACLDCAHLPSGIVADLLFRAELTARANVATVYLKDADRLAREHQAQLAQWLVTEEGVERLPRLLVGICAEPGQDVAPGRLLHELFCGASALVLTVPALRDRLTELPLWVERFLPTAAAVSEKTPKGLTPDAMNHLASHSWPGNLAELHQVLVGACTRAKGDKIESGDLPFYLRGEPVHVEKLTPLDITLEEVEKRLMTVALRMADNNKTRAAELLSIWRPRLLRRMEALGIADKEPRE
ncbi:MAG: sigma 54-interacting transcriptional regulator [Planctomycetes bacterium]|nr:sigma 54-interacting transcriptional regulator [Planctomycetota bacterium]